MHKHILSIFLFLTFFIAGYAQPKHEIRATWLTTLGGLDWPTQRATTPAGIEAQKRELCSILDKLKEANFNTILFQTRLRGDVIYPSKFEPFTESLSGVPGKSPGYDPLRFAIDECHKRGLELHAWIVTIPLGSNRQIKRLGKNAVTKRHPQICKQYNGQWYLDPANPETDRYLASIVKEIVMQYDVDGIHFDYIRYPERINESFDRSSFKKQKREQDLKQWRRNNITRIVRRLYTEVKSIKPWVKVSSSPIGKYKDMPRYSTKRWNAYETACQDAQKWLEEGIQDALFPMIYFKGNQFFPFALNWEENKNGRWIIPGLGLYFLHPEEQDWDIDEILRQISFSRKIKTDGQAFFRNSFLMDDTKGVLGQLKNFIYPYPAAIPPMNRLDTIPPSIPVLISTEREKLQTKIQWKPSTDNSPTTIFYRVYASDTYPVDIENSSNIVEAHYEDTIYTHRASSSFTDKLYWTITAVDRYGNESLPTPVNKPADDDLPVLQTLPPVPSRHKLVITDATGSDLLKSPKASPQIPESFGKGFFRVFIESPDGIRQPVGIIIR